MKEWILVGCAVVGAFAALSVAASLLVISQALNGLIAAMAQQYQDEVEQVARNN